MTPPACLTCRSVVAYGLCIDSRLVWAGACVACSVGKVRKRVVDEDDDTYFNEDDDEEDTENKVPMDGRSPSSTLLPRLNPDS